MNDALAMYGTFSKDPSMWGLPEDTSVIRGNGASVTLSNGRTYLDYVCGLGTNLIGYNNKNFTAWMEKRISGGFGFSLPHVLEAHVADMIIEKIVPRIPGWSRDDVSVRFAKTGSDVATMAVRLARAVTGRDHIYHHGYSGWGSDFIAKTKPAHGIVNYHKCHTHNIDNLNDFNLSTYYTNVAAIMFEQGIDTPPPERYKDIRYTCDKIECLMIVDEVVTGLRYGVGGACERYGIEPDIVIMGKALGNGLPISAMIGRKEHMEWFKRNDPVFCSSTHWGENLSLAAADFVLSIWGDAHVKYVWDVGELFMQGIADAGWKIRGHPARSIMEFDDDYEKAFFIQGMFAHRILMNRPNFISFVHDADDLCYTTIVARALRTQLDYLKESGTDWKKYLKHNLPKTLFSDR